MTFAKVLVLHGHFQTAATFRQRIATLRKHCGNDVEFVFVNAPHVLQPVDIKAPAITHVPSPVEVDPPRGWWNADLDKNKAVGLEESLVSLRDVLKENRFDGVFGFSQGAALAALLAALLEDPSVYPPLLIDGKAPHPPFKFCISISGFIPSDPISQLAFPNKGPKEPRYKTPTLHVIGSNDVIVIEERSFKLANANAEYGRVEQHNGGHFIPAKSTWRKFLLDYMRDPLGDWPSPGLASAPTPAGSGAATPIHMQMSAL